MVKIENLSSAKLVKKYIKIMLFNGLFQNNLYVPIFETEVEDSYMDIFLYRSPRLPDIKYKWVWEIKYIKKEDERELKTVQDKSVGQLKKYKRSHRFENRSDVKFASIIFIGKDMYEIIEV